MQIPDIRSTPDRGDHVCQPVEYGRSALGNRLEYWPAALGETDLLLIAGIHGEEADTTVTLSKALRVLSSAPTHAAVITAVNPDGILRGTRGNANGVDLNRNFPTRDWSPNSVTHCWTMDGPSEVELSSGSSPGSESETTALIELVARLKPKQIITLHGPLGCIDDPSKSRLAQRMSARTGFPLVTDIGYKTPGSFGTWANENQFPIITWEFGPESIEKLFLTTVPILTDILQTGNC